MGLREKCPTCADHTMINNLCAFGAFLVSAGNSPEIPTVFMLLPAKFWMKGMLDGFFLTTGGCTGRET